jgi:hypothetical protein
MTILRTALVVAVVALSVGAAACSSDSTSSSSSGGSGTSGGGTSGTSGSGTSGTSGSTSTNCSKVSICINGACKCGDGPKKDQSCQKTDASGSDYCDEFCKFCS